MYPRIIRKKSHSASRLKRRVRISATIERDTIADYSRSIVEPGPSELGVGQRTGL